MTDQNTRPQPSAEPVDDLIERLREGCKYVYAMDLPRDEYDRQIAMSDAIDRIAALEAQLADAKAALIATGEAAATHLRRAMALEAENARLMELAKRGGGAGAKLFALR